MDVYEIVSQQRIDDFIEKYDTVVSKSVAQLKSERVFIDSTNVIVDRYKSDYHVCIILDYSLSVSDIKRICDALGESYWLITSSLHVSGYEVMIWDKEIHKYFDK